MKANYSKTNLLMFFLSIILVILISCSLLFSINNVAFASEKAKVIINKDALGKYYISDDGDILTEYSNDMLLNTDQQKQILKHFDDKYGADGYELSLGPNFAKVSLIENGNISYGDTVYVKVEVDKIFGGYIDNYTWKYKKDSDQEWTIDKLNHNRKPRYQFGYDKDVISEGTFDVKVLTTYNEFNFGGKQFSCTFESNGLEGESIVITPKEIATEKEFKATFELNVPSSIGIKFKEGRKLGDLDLETLGGLYNPNGKWEISNAADLEKEMTENFEENIKCTFIPSNSGYKPRDFVIKFYSALYELVCLVQDTRSIYGRELGLSFVETWGQQGVKGLAEEDTVADLQLNLYLTPMNNDYHLSFDELEQGERYRVFAEITNEKLAKKYSIRTVNKIENADTVWHINTGGIHQIVAEFYNETIPNIGNIRVSIENGFPVDTKQKIILQSKDIPNKYIEDNNFVGQCIGVTFYNIMEPLKPLYFDGVNFKVSELANNIVKIVYEDKSGWHECSIQNNSVEFKADELTRIAFIVKPDKDYTWIPIVLTVLLGIALGVFILLLVKRFGRKAK